MAEGRVRGAKVPEESLDDVNVLRVEHVAHDGAVSPSDIALYDFGVDYVCDEPPVASTLEVNSSIFSHRPVVRQSSLAASHSRRRD